MAESSFYIYNALLSVSMNGEMKSSVINSNQNLFWGFIYQFHCFLYLISFMWQRNVKIRSNNIINIFLKQNNTDANAINHTEITKKNPKKLTYETIVYLWKKYWNHQYIGGNILLWIGELWRTASCIEGVFELVHVKNWNPFPSCCWFVEFDKEQGLILRWNSFCYH